MGGGWGMGGGYIPNILFPETGLTEVNQWPSLFVTKLGKCRLRLGR